MSLVILEIHDPSFETLGQKGLVGSLPYNKIRFKKDAPINTSLPNIEKIEYTREDNVPEAPHTVIGLSRSGKIIEWICLFDKKDSYAKQLESSTVGYQKKTLPNLKDSNGFNTGIEKILYKNKAKVGPCYIIEYKYMMSREFVCLYSDKDPESIEIKEYEYSPD
jgi:hypothetical protein